MPGTCWAGKVRKREDLALGTRAGSPADLALWDLPLGAGEGCGEEELIVFAQDARSERARMMLMMLRWEDGDQGICPRLRLELGGKADQMGAAQTCDFFKGTSFGSSDFHAKSNA